MTKKMPYFSGLLRYLLPSRISLLFLAYSIALILSLFLAYELRFDFVVPSEWKSLRVENFLWIVPLKLILLLFFGQFGGLLSYFRLPDFYRVFGALGLAGIFLASAWYIFEGNPFPPRGVILGDFVFSLVFIGGFRVGLRVARERYLDGKAKLTKQRRVAIVGAGDVGATIAADMLARRGLGMRPVIFLDDNRKKWRKHVHGITVVGSPDDIAIVSSKFGIEEIIIAMPSAPARRIREIVDRAAKIGLKAEIVPSLAELTTGRVRASRVRPVEIEDLLGRESVKLESDNIRQMVAGRRVLVTGAGGSIGFELSRQLAFYGPERLFLLERAEIQLFHAEQKMIDDGYESVLQPIIADVQDGTRIRQIFEEFKPQIVFHAAAHKHVYLMEREPEEAVKNNALGTQLLADISSEFEVEKFVFISSDKAINPINVMGATKRLAEIYIQALNFAEGNRTNFMAVRFGNVLGSSGSVVPIFREQIARGGPVTVTHPEVERYFMTIPEAVGLVLQCATQGNGGEIFVLDMGDPIKILDMATQMIELSGFRPETDIEIAFIGLRAGEKLHEEIHRDEETLAETRHPRILRYLCDARPLETVRGDFDRLRQKLESGGGIGKRVQYKELLKSCVPEYMPFLDE